MRRAVLVTLLFLGTRVFGETTWIRAGHALDVRSGRWIEPCSILIQDDKFIGVGASVEPPAGARKIDLSNAWVLPGLIDCHTHLTQEIENYTDDRFRKSPIDWAVVSHVYARRTLEAGFTSCRNVGAAEFIDVALKKAIQSGRIVGPRLWVAGHTLSATGGHADITGLSPYIHFDTMNAVADGVDEIRKKVRWNIKYGADLIKFTATAGVLSEEESVGAPQYSLEEMRAIVEEAARWGKRTAAHAHGTEGIKLAIRAGVASIEHGSTLDDEAIALMKEHGTYLVPTVYAGDSVALMGKQWGLPDRLIEKAKSINEKKRIGYRKAIAAGVKFAYGTDVGVFPHGQNAVDFHLLVELGMPPADAIRAATISAADLIGASRQIGSLEAGKFADLLALDADPLKNIRLLEKVPFVMKGGGVIKDQLTGGR